MRLQFACVVYHLSVCACLVVACVARFTSVRACVSKF